MIIDSVSSGMIGYIDYSTDVVLDLEIKFLSGHEIRTMQKTQYIKS